MSNVGYIYIMTNKNRTTLYIGVTNDLCRRIHEHKNHLNKNSFTAKYNLEHCIYFEEFQQFQLAIQREKELKKWNRQKKEHLINQLNPEWKELVTENGFQRNYLPFSKQVEELMKELLPQTEQREETLHFEQQIPHSVRNDDNPILGKDFEGFGKAGHSEQREETLQIKQQQKEGGANE